MVYFKQGINIDQCPFKDPTRLFGIFFLSSESYIAIKSRRALTDHDQNTMAAAWVILIVV